MIGERAADFILGKSRRSRRQSCRRESVARYKPKTKSKRAA